MDDVNNLLRLVTATNVVWTVCRHGIDPRIIDTMTMTLSMTDAIIAIYRFCVTHSIIISDHNPLMVLDSPRSDDSSTK
jgi:hypothetical protein